MSKRLLFAARHALIDSLLCNIPSVEKVVLNNKWRKSPPAIPGCTKIIDTTYRALGISYVTMWLGIERSVPTYIPGLKKKIQENNITDVVVLDIYHWYVWQLLRIKKKRSESLNIYLVVETQELPKNLLTRFIMSQFVSLVKKNQPAFKKCLVWTSRSEAFCRSQFQNTETVKIFSPVSEVFLGAPVKAYGGTNDVLRLICNARYATYKRHEDVLKALNRLKERGVAAELTCIGRADAGKERVEKLVVDCGLKDQVTFLDPVPQDQLVQIYQQHDVLVLPSYNEAVGMVVPEAMACGLPTITSDKVGANVYVEVGETGLVYETGDVDALSIAIEKMTDKALVNEMGEKATARIRTHFTPQKCTKRFKEALDIGT